MRKVALLVTLLPLVLAPSCPVRRFEVVMESTPDAKVRRELTIWVEEDGRARQPEQDMLDQAQAAYGSAGQAVKGKRTFAATFAQVLPTDLIHEALTNFGLFTTTRAPMGTVSYYTEQLPGERRPVEVARGGLKFTNTLVQALTAYVRQHPEIVGEPEKCEKLIGFLETEFRDDMLSMLLIGWQASARLSAIMDSEPQKESPEEAFAYVEGFRALSYLVERGYLRADDITLVSETLVSEESAVVVARGIIRKIAGVLGYSPTAPLPPALAKLTNPEELDRVLDAGLVLIDVSREEFVQLLEPAIPDFVFPDATEGTVTWRCPSKPLCTNGTWDAEDKELRWEGRGRKGCWPPQVLFAIWAQSNVSFQRERFGAVAVEGDSLTLYVAWREALTVDQRTQWDAFLDTLRPGKDLVEKLESFRFRSATTRPAHVESAPPDEPPRGVQIIVEALSGDD